MPKNEVTDWSTFVNFPEVPTKVFVVFSNFSYFLGTKKFCRISFNIFYSNTTNSAVFLSIFFFPAPQTGILSDLVKYVRSLQTFGRGSDR